jgi:hypothetical protein
LKGVCCSCGIEVSFVCDDTCHSGDASFEKWPRTFVSVLVLTWLFSSGVNWLELLK